MYASSSSEGRPSITWGSRRQGGVLENVAIDHVGVHREKKINWIKEILAHEIFICRQWNNLFDSMISFIWMTTVSMKFGNIESN